MSEVIPFYPKHARVQESAHEPAPCEACPRHCVLPEDAVGACRARRERDGIVMDDNYGRVTALAIDPIEKKPLARYMPGTRVLSIGSYGCNLRCPWCQNHEIAQVGEHDVAWREILPADLVRVACLERERDPRMVGIAYTYNEPLVGWEYVRDCAELAMAEGLVNVLVSNGCFEERVVREIAPLMDAANIDLKSFSEETYRFIGGDLEQVKRTIAILAAAPTCHLEVTCLIVPGVNDTPEEMGRLARWLAALDEDLTLHVTRFHPAWRFHDRPPTSRALVRELAEVAREVLPNVYLGNM